MRVGAGRPRRGGDVRDAAHSLLPVPVRVKFHKV
uniref:Uncharacterized protein n=1 Tax=Peronospora matthiolae TaxID=2874970 RepID=A0AAV1U0T9_9STRA